MKQIAKVFCIAALYASAAIALPAETTFTTLYSFVNGTGAFPAAGVVQAANGDLYGTTEEGGNNPSYAGSVFKITPGGNLTTEYSFCAQMNCADGEFPFAGPVQATNGELYGTTQTGGATNGGTVYRITSNGTLTTLYSFCAETNCADGAQPLGLVQAANGNLYGTTYNGGIKYNTGTIYEITPSGTLTTLHRFCVQKKICPDGYGPYGGLIQAADGNLYGTTQLGGANKGGTIFKITPSGKLTTLYSFCAEAACADGAEPTAGVIQATDRNLYGTTQDGGANHSGTVFQITTSGALTTLYSFCAQTGCADGSFPDGPLIQATDGDLYGTTLYGGTNGQYYGTIFKITTGGALTTLHSFCAQTNCPDGKEPHAGLVQDTNGDLYGTTQRGGALINSGSVFRLSVGLGRFVKTLTTSGKVGATVKILGTSLTGATSISFNGTEAEFRVNSSSEITAIVPSGASSGTVQVVTPGATLESNVPFEVRP